MPQYDYICMNPDCNNVYFSVVETIAEHTVSHMCPSCKIYTKSRHYNVPPVVYKATNAKQARGFTKLEADILTQQREANSIADDMYANRSKQGYEQWVKKGGEDQLYEDLAKQNFKPDKTSIISTSAGTTTTGNVSTPGDS